MIKLNRLTRGLQTQKFLFYLPIVYCRLQIRKASHQIEIHCFLKPSVLMENFAKTHQRFVVPDIPMFSPTETVLSIKEKFEFIQSPIFDPKLPGIDPRPPQTQSNPLESMQYHRPQMCFTGCDILEINHNFTFHTCHSLILSHSHFVLIYIFMWQNAWIILPGSKCVCFVKKKL